MTEQPRPAAPPAPDAGHLPMTEEMDNPRRTLPPARVLLLTVAGLAVVVAILLWATQHPPASGGSIDHIGVVEQQGGEHVLVAVHITLENLGAKMLWLRNVKADFRTAGGEFSDEASSAVDHERYFTAYPELRQHAIEPLVPETQIPSGQTRKGMVIFGFPVSRAAFEAREAFTVTVEPYDRAPLVLQEALQEARPAAPAP